MARIESPIKDNSSLRASKAAQRDEFYTQLTDIENELKHYRKHFKDKVVLCNCDDPFESNFFKYFVLNFNRLGIKKLIATCYNGSPIAGTQLSLFDDVPAKTFATPYKAVVTSVRDVTGDGGIDMLDVAELFRMGENKLTKLKGDGDFRSEECLKLMDEADIVVTNPPFSLFREYVATLMEHKKGFVIIGNQNAITYKEIFPLLKSNDLWLGYHSGHTLFAVPDTYEIPEHLKGSDRARIRGAGYKVDENGRLWRDLGNICWFTNLDIKKRHEEMVLVKSYSPECYPHYDNYDAIEVSKAADIPCDYAGAMGVPITFMDKFSPEQFEILGADLDLAKPIQSCIPSDSVYEKGGPAFYLFDGRLDDGRERHRRLYKRIVIRNRNPEAPED